MGKEDKKVEEKAKLPLQETSKNVRVSPCMQKSTVGVSIIIALVVGKLLCRKFS